MSSNNRSNSSNINRVVKHDPNGLIQHDMAELEQVFKNKPISPKMTHDEIMYAAGQQNVLDYIRRNMIAKR